MGFRLRIIVTVMEKTGIMQNSVGAFKTVYVKDDGGFAAMFLSPDLFSSYDKELQVGFTYELTFANVRIRKPPPTRDNMARAQFFSISPSKPGTITDLGECGKSSHKTISLILKRFITFIV